jgi:predicted nucleic acid-binding protein
MGYERKMIVSNSGPLIHLAKAGSIDLLKELFGEVMIPYEVKLEVIDRGKDEGMADAFLIESEVENGWIVVDKSNSSKLKELSSSAGIDIGEAAAIMLAKSMKCAVLIDDLGARRFAIGMGLQVVGSIGVLIRCAKVKIISKSEALEALDKLGRVMWLSIDVYEDARKIIEDLRSPLP